MSCVRDGWLSTHWDQIAAATGRLTSFQPNVQAVPKAAVEVIERKKNYVYGNLKSSKKYYISTTEWWMSKKSCQPLRLRRSTTLFSFYFKTPLGGEETPIFSLLKSLQIYIINNLLYAYYRGVLFFKKYLVIHLFLVNSHWYYRTITRK